jgi:dihydropyrimidinase
MAVMYTECVQRGLKLERFVEITSTNAARIFGMYPQKGAILPGSDADLVIMDPTPRRVRSSDLHESDYTIWEGREVAAWPEMTILRGKVIVDGRHFAGAPTDGRRISRKIDADVLSRPAC